MDERALQFRVGGMVLATLLITGDPRAALRQFADAGRTATIPSTSAFPRAPGVAPDTPVRKSGILIGRVTDIHFVKDDTAVRLTVSIDPDRTIYHDEVCRIVNSLMGVGGDTVLEFVRMPGPAAAARHAHRQRRNHPGHRRRRPHAGDRRPGMELGEHHGPVYNASDALARTFTRIDTLLSANEHRITRSSPRPTTRSRSCKTTLDHTDDIIGDAETRKQFKNAIAHFPTCSRKPATAQQLGDAMDTVQEEPAQPEGLTEPLGKRGRRCSCERMTKAPKAQPVDGRNAPVQPHAEQPRQLARPTGEQSGTLPACQPGGKNIDDLTRQLKPILDDARVFSDKIARHPETLGVRGAVQRSPGIK